MNTLPMVEGDEFFGRQDARACMVGGVQDG
jgi:hypothetical protein